ncbi:TIGR00341 family protein [Algoriphagus taiwanensis]|uniref:TIGR00341 family protein n=1 Tax=Algoriphagus taiwanensis TaxID=1445656 RepID=A0ABQ6PZ93_9BACT|nr:hypothetical protein Ataiwa_15180 [Algoriphagus taiwanensis]
MNSYYLIFDPSIPEDERASFFEKLDPQPQKTISWKEFELEQFSAEDHLLLWLSDGQCRSILGKLKEKDNPNLALLPHPDLRLFAKALGIDSSKEKAFNWFLEHEKSQTFDLLSVNGEICISSLVIGESLSVLFDPRESDFFRSFGNRFSRFLKLFRKVKLETFKIKIKNENEEKELEVAAMGILAAGHNESSLVFKRLIEDSGLNDGLLHVLILAPKSLFSIIQFGLQNLFFPIKGGRIPDFVSYVSTEYLEVSCKKEFTYALDGKEEKAEKLELKVSEQEVNILAGFEQTKESESKRKEINLNRLPTGKLREALTRGYLPWVRHATTEEFKDLFTLLKKNSETTSSFLVLMALSTLIATFGLFANSSPVVIGAMILAPLMGPIISLAMGALRQDGILIKSSLITLFWGILLGLVFAVVITWITPLKTMNAEILARIRPNLLDLGIAVASGVAGAYAHSKEEIAKTLAGVAISVALVPPLAVSGIGLGWGEWNVFWGAALLLGTNLAGIVLAAALTFLVLGFSPFQLAKKGLFISLGLLILVTAPLFLSFREMVRENQLIQRLSGSQIPHGTLREVKIRNLSPLRISVTILSDKELHTEDFSQIKSEIETSLGQAIELELTLGVMVK